MLHGGSDNGLAVRTRSLAIGHGVILPSFIICTFYPFLIVSVASIL